MKLWYLSHYMYQEMKAGTSPHICKDSHAQSLNVDEQQYRLDWILQHLQVLEAFANMRQVPKSCMLVEEQFVAR